MKTALFAIVLLGAGEALAATDVAVDVSALHTGDSTVTVKIGPAVALFQDVGTATLDDGVWSVTTYDQSARFGTFTLSGGVITATTLAVIATGPASIGIDPTKLASVHVTASPLSVPGGFTTLKISTSIGAGVNVLMSGDATFYLPDAFYYVTDYGSDVSYGTFTVAGGAVTSATQAVVAVAGGITFNTSALAKVDIALGTLSIPAGLSVVRVGTAGGAVGTLFQGSGTLYLPDAQYQVTNYDGTAPYGAITVAGGAITAASGSLSAAGGALTFDRCALHLVDIDVGASTAAIDSTSLLFSGVAEFALPAGNYLLQNGLGTFAIDGTGALTASPAAGVSISTGTCSAPPPGYTPAGANVTTSLGPISLTFSTVTQAGTTSVTTSGTGQPPPEGFKLGAPPSYFDVTTTAVYSGTLHICIDYSGVSYGNTSQLRLLHLESGTWVDRTTSIDTVAQIICGTTTSLSPFIVVQRALPVTIDISPGSSPNVINVGSHAAVSVAILGAAGFDATRVDPASVRLAGAPVRATGNGSLVASVADVNHDGRADLVVQVTASAMHLAAGDQRAALEGRTFDGLDIRGTDSVRVIH